jgi:hypothetical protein
MGWKPFSSWLDVMRYMDSGVGTETQRHYVTVSMILPVLGQIFTTPVALSLAYRSRTGNLNRTLFRFAVFYFPCGHGVHLLGLYFPS